MDKELPKVQLDFITPSPGPVLLRSMVQYASGFLGIQPSGLLTIIRGKDPSPRYRFLRQFLGIQQSSQDLTEAGDLVAEIYGFPNSEFAFSEFLESQKSAKKLVEYLIGLYGLDPDRFGLKDEVSIPDPSLMRMFAYMNPRSNDVIKRGTSLRSRFEQLRELVLCDLFLRSSIRTQEEGPFVKISKLQQRFNNELYEGQAGEGKLVRFNVSFNRQNGVDKISRTHRKGTREKIEEMRRVRVGNKDIYIQVDFDTKQGFKKIIKLILRFVERGIFTFDPDGIDPNGDPLLEDRQRFRVVVYGNNDDILAVHNRIAPFFDEIKEKQINRDHGQNPTVKRRFIAKFQGIPFEIIYYDERGYLNSERHTGIIKTINVPVRIGNKQLDAVFHLYDGSAHELYEIRRSLSIIFLMFPYEVYKLPGQTEEEYLGEIISMVQRKDYEIAGRLRNSD